MLFTLPCSMLVVEVPILSDFIFTGHAWAADARQLRIPGEKIKQKC